MNKPSLLDRSAGIRQLYNAIAVIMVGLLPISMAYVLWDREKERVEREAELDFAFRVQEATAGLRARMLACEQLLRGAAGTLSVSKEMTGDNWRNYVQLLGVTKIDTGMAGIAFAPIVSRNRLNEFVLPIRRSGQPDYEVWPQEDRAQLAPIRFIEPLTEQNQQRLGFDLYSDPTRLTALAIAEDSGEAALSGRVAPSIKAVGQSPSEIEIFVPVYRPGSNPTTTTQRRNLLVGFVAGGLRIDTLLDELLRQTAGLDLRIYDSGSGPGKAPLAQRQSRSPSGSSAPRLSAQQQVEIGQRIWTLQFSSSEEFERGIDDGRSRRVLAFSLLMGGLLIGLIWSLANTRDRAVKLAGQMTIELRESRDALLKSEQQLSLALQGSNLAIFDWDVATDSVQLSAQWVALLGGTPQPTATTIAELEQLVHPDDQARLAKEMHAVVSGEAESYQVEYRVRSLAGEWLWIASRAKVVRRDAQGRALRVTGTNADISQRKQIEKMKDEFIGIVSHELRTPLTAILGALGLLSAQDAPDGEDAKMLLDMAYQNSERLTALVNDVLDIEKLEAGMMEMQIAPTTLEPFLLRAVELNRSYADRFDVRYELRGPIPAVSVSVDAERLMQVMTNLLSNATKFSPTGGTVAIGAEVQGDRVRVSVSDTGPGIPAEFRDRVFQKFAQADASSTRRKGGTGLGLWICQTIIDKLDGRIGYESAPGNGATFYFDLPVATA